MEPVGGTVRRPPRRRVLIVDDDGPTRALLAMVLRQAGYDVVPATDGPAALACIATEDIALALVDATTPGMLGTELVSVLRADRATRSIPVILVTGERDVSERVLGSAPGADDYLVKPVDVHELVARVDAQLTGAGPLRETAQAVRAAPANATRDRVGAWLAESAFVPYAQPVVDLGTGDVVGHEALTRWLDGTPPATAFALARLAGLGDDLELATIEASVAASRLLPPDGWLSLNVTPALIDNPRLAELAARSPRDLVLEIRVDQPVPDAPAHRRTADRLGPRVRLAIDQVGTDPRSLRAITELRPSFVKPGLRLIRDIERRPEHQERLALLRVAAEAVGGELVVEGIETETLQRRLRTCGVRLGQGYLLGRPAPVSEPVLPRPAGRVG